jgi:hypothetical protein
MNDDGCGNSRYKGDNLDDEEGNFVLKEEIEGGVDGQITQPEAYSYTCGSLLCVFVTYSLHSEILDVLDMITVAKVELIRHFFPCLPLINITADAFLPRNFFSPVG